MPEQFLAKVLVIPPPGEQSQVAYHMPEDFAEEDLNRIAVVINNSVIALQNQLRATEGNKPDQLALSEVEIRFGIDLQGEAKIPIIGPLLQIGYKAGATFQVQIKLTKQSPEG